MPTARLSTGKTVAPRRPPRMHTLRGVQIRPTSFHPFPVGEELVLAEGVSIEASRVVLGDRLSYELPTGDLFAPPVESLPAALEPTWLAAEPLLPPGTGPVMGSRFPALPVGAGDGGLVDPAAEEAGAGNLWELTFPLLEREGWEAEAGSQDEPRLRAYQVEAAQALMAQEALLLGHGKFLWRGWKVAATLLRLCKVIPI